MKKPLLFKIPTSEKESFKIQIDDLAYFYDPLHFHPEIQLTYIVESNGTFFIGDNIKSFKSGDILLIGSNLTHVFRNDRIYYDSEKHRAKSISAFFTEDSFGTNFFNLPEAYKVKRLLQRASRGIKILGSAKEKVSRLLKEIHRYEGFDRILYFLKVLSAMAETDEVEYLSSLGSSKYLKEADSKKINDVFEYVLQNFSDNIKLNEVAGIANMSVTSFCRYFKLRTRKTFSLFLNEIRIGHACKLLKENKYNISEICYECGFNNISNFNRQFKTITGFTPTIYKKKFSN